MVKFKVLPKDQVQYYHQYACYYGNPEDDTTWEPGESYVYDAKTDSYIREMIPLPYDPLFIITDEDWLKNRILAYADENPLMCDIQNRANVEFKRDPWTRTMVASIPRGMYFLCQQDES